MNDYNNLQQNNINSNSSQINKKNNHKLAIDIISIGLSLIAIGIALLYFSGSKKIKVVETDLQLSVNEVILLVGEQKSIEYKIIPDNVTDKHIIWYSNNNAVATVENGTITAVAPGTTRINAQTVNGIISSVFVICTKTKDLKFEKDIIELNEGDAADVGITSNSNVQYAVTESNILNISNSGHIIAIGKGTTYVIAKDGEGNFTIMKVIVK